MSPIVWFVFVTLSTYKPVRNLTILKDGKRQETGYASEALGLTNLVDAGGPTRYQYTITGLLQSEAGPWDDDMASFVYTDRLRVSLSLSDPSGETDGTQAHGYDGAACLTSLLSPAGSFGHNDAPHLSTSAPHLVVTSTRGPDLSGGLLARAESDPDRPVGEAPACRVAHLSRGDSHRCHGSSAWLEEASTMNTRQGITPWDT